MENVKKGNILLSFKLSSLIQIWISFIFFFFESPVFNVHYNSNKRFKITTAGEIAIQAAFIIQE